jgi:hypothetical protein
MPEVILERREVILDQMVLRPFGGSVQPIKRELSLVRKVTLPQAVPAKDMQS